MDQSRGSLIIRAVATVIMCLIFTVGGCVVFNKHRNQQIIEAAMAHGVDPARIMCSLGVLDHMDTVLCAIVYTKDNKTEEYHQWQKSISKPLEP